MHCNVVTEQSVSHSQIKIGRCSGRKLKELKVARMMFNRSHQHRLVLVHPTQFAIDLHTNEDWLVG